MRENIRSSGSTLPGILFENRLRLVACRRAPTSMLWRLLLKRARDARQGCRESLAQDGGVRKTPKREETFAWLHGSSSRLANWSPSFEPSAFAPFALGIRSLAHHHWDRGGSLLYHQTNGSPDRGTSAALSTWCVVPKARGVPRATQAGAEHRNPEATRGRDRAQAGQSFQDRHNDEAQPTRIEVTPCLTVGGAQTAVRRWTSGFFLRRSLRQPCAQLTCGP